jgi:protein-L-isoaspartate(D-aspartate) O-methyltransferase (PCMT)
MCLRICRPNSFQPAILRPITERLLRSVELSEGMSVLDLGSGVGNVALLAAERVGPSGAVVGLIAIPDLSLPPTSGLGLAAFSTLSSKFAPLTSFLLGKSSTSSSVDMYWRIRLTRAPSLEPLRAI